MQCKQGMEHTVLKEKERFTQIQWDMEELRKQCMEMELYEAHTETTNQSLVQENQMLLQQIDDLRDKFEDLRKEHEERSKAELMVLVKEVKSFRTSQSELKQELTRTMKEKLEMDTQLLSEEVGKPKLATSEEQGGTDDVVRKMLTEVLIDNARLRKQINYVLRCSWFGHGTSRSRRKC
ncbi:hypothetical protein F2Q70_00010045 [Brassica cretica]|uniref:Uncharacterized protein n=1 Tax=Brassica cretica TaxID=69181 RepID=A0A8S9JGM8_BRACR|nr:hypothetical protein F2Q68_00003034 [Brassica cretica]KAF2616100.1 hypothetical protein F2Q70_00010045 [Brassica cretica]